MPRAHLPLGIDLGASRIRIAVIEIRDGNPILNRILIRDHQFTDDDPRRVGQEIRTMLREQRISERRAVAAVGEPQASLHEVRFPPMSTREREQAARYEAQRYLTYPVNDALVRVFQVDAKAHTYMLALAQRSHLRHRIDSIRAAGLQLIGIDHDAFALRRIFRHADAILDVGHTTSRLYAYVSAIPFGAPLLTGSSSFTDAIARGLALDASSAERHKVAFGLAGAAEGELADFARSVAKQLLDARNQGAHETQVILLVGNGARLSALSDRLQKDTGCSVIVAPDLGSVQSSYADDVTRAGAPDWALSSGIALWNFSPAAAA